MSWPPLGEVRHLPDALGERRDRDVAIASLEAFGADLPAPDRRGVHGLVELLRLEQARANEELRPYVKAERLASLCERLRELADAAERRAGRGPPLPSLTSFAGNGDGSR
ncbi:MAG: CHAD domain-containing protein [Solirubrobacterales bacterium]